MTWTEGDKDITDMDYRNDITNKVCSARSWVEKNCEEREYVWSVHTSLAPHWHTKSTLHNTLYS